MTNLKSGDVLLLEIAEYFSDKDKVMALATYLLENVGTGGPAFLKAHEASTSRPASLAHLVLREWCDQRPLEATGPRLYHVLKKTNVHPAAALQFKCQLLPDSWARGKPM